MSPPLLWIVWAVVGVVVGAYGTLIGAGGGFVLVPILLIVYLMIMAGGATLTHVLHGDFGGLVPVTLAISVGVILGAQVGARASSRVGGGMIIRLLAIALGLVGIRLLLFRG